MVLVTVDFGGADTFVMLGIRGNGVVECNELTGVDAVAAPNEKCGIVF